MNSNTKSFQYEILVVSLCFFGWGLAQMDRIAISWMMPVIQPALEITNTQVGQLGFATNIMYVVSAIGFAFLSDRIGSVKKLLVPLLVLMGCAAGAGVFAKTFGQLFIIRCFVGIFEGPMLPLMATLVKRASADKRFGMNMGIVNCGVGLLAATAGAILITQLVQYYSWQMTFLLSSIPTFVIAILFAVLIKDIKEDVSEKATETVKPKLTDVLKYRNVVVCCVLGVLGMCGYWTGMLFAPLYLTNVANLSVQAMGAMGGVMGILYVIYCYIIPTLSDKFGRKPIIAIAFFLAAISPFSMFVLNGAPASVTLYVIFAGFAASMTPLYMSIIPMESVPLNLLATANAVVMGAGDLLGTACYPIIAGKIADVSGLSFMMLFAAIFFILNVIISLVFLKETHPRKRKIAGAGNIAAK